jgi:hypothetical protein
MGKGSTRRREDTEKILNYWDAIFGKKDKKEEKPRDDQPKENAK